MKNETRILFSSVCICVGVLLLLIVIAWVVVQSHFVDVQPKAVVGHERQLQDWPFTVFYWIFHLSAMAWFALRQNDGKKAAIRRGLLMAAIGVAPFPIMYFGYKVFFEMASPLASMIIFVIIYAIGWVILKAFDTMQSDLAKSIVTIIVCLLVAGVFGQIRYFAFGEKVYADGDHYIKRYSVHEPMHEYYRYETDGIWYIVNGKQTSRPDRRLFYESR